MCNNDNCSKKDKCYRYLAVPDMYWQTFAHFKDKNCNFYWPVRNQTVRTVEEVDEWIRKARELNDEERTQEDY